MDYGINERASNLAHELHEGDVNSASQIIQSELSSYGPDETLVMVRLANQLEFQNQSGFGNMGIDSVQITADSYGNQHIIIVDNNFHRAVAEAASIPIQQSLSIAQPYYGQMIGVNQPGSYFFRNDPMGHNSGWKHELLDYLAPQYNHPYSGGYGYGAQQFLPYQSSRQNYRQYHHDGHNYIQQNWLPGQLMRQQYFQHNYTPYHQPRHHNRHHTW